ncbi:MAG: FxLYD domain-containing protein [Acidobacteriia bacterium]|nr:FxLYD domain-containing protein [Terriglobia bacterium]
MPSRFRQFVESVLYAGLKPNAPRKESKRGGFLGSILERFERFLAGRAPTDPLYLSRRTWRQKLRLGLTIGAPCVLLLAALAVAMSNMLPKSATPLHEPTPAEIVAKLLPDLDKTVKLDVNRDAEVVEVHAEKGPGARITGLVRNRTNRAISVEVTLELTDDAGSRLGAVEGRVDKIPPRNTIPFQFPAKETHAAFALVREIRTVQ